MIREEIKQAIESAIKTAQSAHELPVFDVPIVGLAKPRPEMGDYSTSIAMQLARVAKMSPQHIAERIAKHLSNTHAQQNYTVEVVGGYINFRLTPVYLATQVAHVLSLGVRWGNINIGNGQAAQVEHGSANPTGYATIGTARNVIVGDTLANTLTAAGYKTHREWYINDAGSQVKKFGASVFARYCQHFAKDEPMPADSYLGDDVIQTAERIAKSHGEQFLALPREQAVLALGKLGIDTIMSAIKATLLRLNIRYDNFFSEKSLQTSGLMNESLDMLRSKGLLLEFEGATWFSEDGSPIRKGQGKKKTDSDYAGESIDHDADDEASSDASVEKDEKGKKLPIQAVVVRSANVVADPDERTTYFASDIPYVWNKVKIRGFNPAVYVWGEDHQADVPRVYAAAQALGLPENTVKIIIYRFITLMSGGQEVRMGKRKGNAIWIDDVLDLIGSDALRYIMLSRSVDTKFAFDLDLLKEQNDRNPVYYVQYGHARICSIERRVAEKGQSVALDMPLIYDHPAELGLIRKILELPEIVELVVNTLQPHHYTTYAREIAQAFSIFYENCRILDTTPDIAGRRLKLAQVARLTLARVLDIMGMSAPEKM